MYKTTLFFHVLGAAVWVGGHLLLALRYLPAAIKEKDISMIRMFERQYEVIGIPSLLVQIITGVWIAFGHYGLTLMSFDDPLQRVISFKLLLLFLTFGLTIHAQFFIIPFLTPEKLPLMGFHIVAVTVTGVCMLFFGVMFRVGGI